MYPYPQSLNPAVRTHLDAQTAFMNELSRTYSDSLQQLVQLNMQLGQALLQETAGAAQRMLATGQATDALAAAAAHAQPATDRLQSYRQQLSQLAAATQVDLTAVTERHGQETSRTARALADELTRVTADETGKRLREQEDGMRSMREAFQKEAERGARAGAQFAGSLQSGADGAGAKPDGQARHPSGGNQQGGNGQAGNKGAAQAR